MRKGKREQDIESKTKHKIMDPMIKIKEINLICRDYPPGEIERQIDNFEDKYYPTFSPGSERN